MRVYVTDGVHFVCSGFSVLLCDYYCSSFLIAGFGGVVPLVVVLLLNIKIPLDSPRLRRKELN